MDRNYHKRKKKNLNGSFLQPKPFIIQLKIPSMQPEKMIQKKYNKTVRLIEKVLCYTDIKKGTKGVIKCQGFIISV